MKQPTHRPLKGFTLIELLIVVAIIAILAAIAVPNFLEAQTRSKISRAKADMRSLATAIESYRVDGNGYPLLADAEGNEITPYPAAGPEVFEARLSSVVTTPISYITSRPLEPFAGKEESEDPQYHYATRAYQKAKEGDVTELEDYMRAMLGDEPAQPRLSALGSGILSIEYFLLSHGPDSDHDSPELDENPDGPALYDPSNGTTSSGDIVYWGPGMGFKN